MSWAGDSPAAAARTRRVLTRTDVAMPHCAVRTDAPAARRASVGVARTRLTSSRSLRSPFSDTEDRQVYHPGAETQNGTVQHQQPFVLAHARSQQLGEVLRGHLLDPLTDELTDVAALLLVELLILER